MHDLKGRPVNIALRAALSLMVLGWLIYYIGSSDILAQMQLVPYPTLAISTAILAASVLIVAPRWSYVLRALGYRIPSRELLGSVYLGSLFNQLLPSQFGGDVIRAWRARQLGVPWEPAIHSVLFDRASAVGIVFIGALVLLPFINPVALRDEFIWITGAAAAIGVAILVIIFILGRERTPLPLPEWLARACSELSANAMALIRQPSLLLSVSILALLNQGLVVISVWLLAHAMHVTLPPVDFVMVMFASTLVSTIPISFAGWGLREGAFVMLLGAYGVAPQTAFAVSVLLGLCLLAASAPAALLLLGGLGRAADAAPATDWREGSSSS